MPFNAMTSGGFMIVVTDNSLNYSKIAYFRGQIISECLFDFLNFPKNHRKIWQISAQGSKKWSNHKRNVFKYIK